jgi:hypothetical protein
VGVGVGLGIGGAAGDATTGPKNESTIVTDPPG